MYEWCWDWNGDYSSSPVTDPRGPSEGGYRVYRGGGLYNLAVALRSANRECRTPSYRYYALGFRLLRTAETDSQGSIATVNEFPEEVPLTDANLFVLVEAGTFRMGSELSLQEIMEKYGGSEEWYTDALPVHSVTISRPFYMSKYEVTLRQWREVMDFNPPDSTPKADELPVETISWYDAVEYCNRLSRKEGFTPSYSGGEDNISCDFSANGYRLPTEAEWEYAARGGAQSRGYIFAGSNSKDDVSWHSGNSSGKTHAVGQKQPNELGLYDMNGNVVEWCWDWYADDYYASSPATDPRGPARGLTRVYQGGGRGSNPARLRIAFRGYYTPSNRYDDLGFRPVRNAD